AFGLRPVNAVQLRCAGTPMLPRYNAGVTQPTPVIIEAALNGGTPRSRNANVPRTPPEIAADGIRCIGAGAAIVHNHNDEPVVGGASGVHRAEPYIEAWREILAACPGALLYPT